MDQQVPEAPITIYRNRVRGHLPCDKPAVIYVLRDPRDSEVRYVGVTTKRLKQRYAEHCSAARRGVRSYAYRWMRQVFEAGLLPEMVVIEHIEAGGDWIEAERRWIKHYREIGARLVNLTDGGDGVPGRKATAEQRAALSKAFKGRVITPSWRAAMSATRKQQGLNPTLRKLLTESPPMLGRTHSEAAKRKISEAAKGRIAPNKGKPHSLEAVEKIRAHALANPSAPKFRARAVLVDGVTYDSMSAAGRALDVKQRDINYWIRRGRAFYADGNNPVVKPPGKIGRPPKQKAS